MTNPFVDYLNSMNNSGSNTVSALAEAQVLSPYYEKIKVERCLGRYLSDLVSDGRGHAVVLTGHAGDGKTSILVQVLSELGMLEKDTPLKEEMLYSQNGVKLYAVKDMSELPEEKQTEFCRKGLDYSGQGISSLIISNTGPLLKCFETIVKEDHEKHGKEFGESERSELQNKVLQQLDENSRNEIKLGDHSVLIINIARIDNVDFAEKVMEKIISDEMWEPCSSCEKCNKCSIYNNRNVVKKHFGRVSAFVTAFYRYLYENDKRMTIRQMLSQISFAITGNQTCSDIKPTSKETAKFNYMFPNLFFGYCGLPRIDSAMQIQGIAYANEFKIDSIALNDDYKMFVTGDFTDIPEDVRPLVKAQFDIFSKKHICCDEKPPETNENDVMYRRAMRRFYIMLSLGNGYNYTDVFDELFGKSFNNYVDLLNGNVSVKIKNDIKKTVLEALYMEATGTAAKNSDTIPLTVRRNDDVYQKVMITNGKLKKEDIKIEAVPADNVFEDNKNKHNVILKICDKKDYQLSLPLITYFEQVANGSVSTAADPSLTHGISKLKATLLEYGKETGTGDAFKVLLNRTDDPMYIDMEFDDNKLYFS